MAWDGGFEVGSNDQLDDSSTKIETEDKLTPGSVTEACRKEDTQMKKIYANTIGIAGETLCHNHGALSKYGLSAENPTSRLSSLGDTYE